MSIRIGTAGWSIPRGCAAQFRSAGSSLERYSQMLGCAEINSTFYRPHRVTTYQRWAAAVPEEFRFSVKVPKAITHECGLQPAAAQIRSFLDEVSHLGGRLGPVLLQLPPRQGFDQVVARRFFSTFREEYLDGAVVLEPRHADWFGEEADSMLRAYRIGRVAADPGLAPEALRPGGDPSLVYYRLHGAPRMYYSSYSPEYLELLAAELARWGQEAEVWCIFDNTASGAAMENALALLRLVRGACSV